MSYLPPYLLFSPHASSVTTTVAAHLFISPHLSAVTLRALRTFAVVAFNHLLASVQQQHNSTSPLPLPSSLFFFHLSSLVRPASSLYFILHVQTMPSTSKRSGTKLRNLLRGNTRPQQGRSTAVRIVAHDPHYVEYVQPIPVQQYASPSVVAVVR